MKEEFKEIEINGLKYLVSNFGKIIGKSRGRELKQRVNRDGYLEVTVGKFENRTTERVHRIVAKVFVPNPNKELLTEVNHKDFNRLNARSDNLEWVTHTDNVSYSSKAGHYGNLGEINGRSKLTKEKVLEIRERYKNGITQKELSIMYDTPWSTIHNIVIRNTWKHI